jgi:hypothetical protein
MQIIAKTVPNENTTKKTPNTLSQTKPAKVNAPLKNKSNEANNLARLLGAYCDCV